MKIPTPLCADLEPFWPKCYAAFSRACKYNSLELGTYFISHLHNFINVLVPSPSHFLFNGASRSRPLVLYFRFSVTGFVNLSFPDIELFGHSLDTQNRNSDLTRPISLSYSDLTLLSFRNHFFMISSIRAYVFAPCIVIQLCNVNQQNAFFKLIF